MDSFDALKAKFVRLAKRGKTLERKWAKAEAADDKEKMAELQPQVDAFYKAWDKYEEAGLRIVLSRHQYLVTREKRS